MLRPCSCSLCVVLGAAVGDHTDRSGSQDGSLPATTTIILIQIIIITSLTSYTCTLQTLHLHTLQTLSTILEHMLDHFHLTIDVDFRLYTEVINFFWTQTTCFWLTSMLVYKFATFVGHNFAKLLCDFTITFVPWSNGLISKWFIQSEK